MNGKLGKVLYHSIKNDLLGSPSHLKEISIYQACRLPGKQSSPSGDCKKQRMQKWNNKKQQKMQ